VPNALYFLLIWVCYLVSLSLLLKMREKVGLHLLFLNQVGCMELTNSVFSALPTFNMCTFQLPKIMIKQIDKFRRHCFWWGTDINAKSPPKAPWEMLCQIKSYGGLGVLNLRSQWGSSSQALAQILQSVGSSMGAVMTRSWHVAYNAHHDHHMLLNLKLKFNLSKKMNQNCSL
jgi:hypothetical protein